MKKPLTPAGIEPATFRFVAEHLNHCAKAVPLWLVEGTKIRISMSGVMSGNALVRRSGASKSRLEGGRGILGQPTNVFGDSSSQRPYFGPPPVPSLTVTSRVSTTSECPARILHRTRLSRSYAKISYLSSCPIPKRLCIFPSTLCVVPLEGYREIKISSNVHTTKRKLDKFYQQNT